MLDLMMNLMMLNWGGYLMDDWDFRFSSTVSTALSLNLNRDYWNSILILFEI